MYFTIQNNLLSVLSMTRGPLGLLKHFKNNLQSCHCPNTRKFSFDPVNIFDRNAKRIQRERAANSQDVELYDYIKDEVGYRLADRVFDVKKKFNVCVDLGASRGFVSKHILADTVEHLIMCEMSPTMLKQAESTPGVKVTKTEVDEEVFSENIADESVDLVISNLSLHWINDLPGCFVRIMKCLKPDGVFMASLFGGETLYELRSALHLAEMERKDEIVVGYPSMFELMWDLKGMAENNAAFNRSLHLYRESLIAASAIYDDMYKKPDGGVSATFQVIYLVAWKPSPNQPKALPRGSGKVSLKDLDKVVEGKIK
uniref:Arginine-hydroxylase NDUFAF5, mitochondrial n=1 Tax=Phlebotomus papatasi TaxID=29031 RepID=A0A1B0D4A9_PHLPP